MTATGLLLILATAVIIGSEAGSSCSSGSACNKIRNDNWRKQKNGKLTVCCVSSAAPYIQLKQQKNGKRICTCQRKTASKPSYTRTKPGNLLAPCKTGLACKNVPKTSLRRRKEGKLTFCCPSASTPYVWFDGKSHGGRGFCMCRNTAPKQVKRFPTKRRYMHWAGSSVRRSRRKKAAAKKRKLEKIKREKEQIQREKEKNAAEAARRKVEEIKRKKDRDEPKEDRRGATYCKTGTDCNQVENYLKQKDGDVMYCCPYINAPSIWFNKKNYNKKGYCYCHAADTNERIGLGRGEKD